MSDVKGNMRFIRFAILISSCNKKENLLVVSNLEKIHHSCESVNVGVSNEHLYGVMLSTAKKKIYEIIVETHSVSFGPFQ